jgi:hypothetical protein
MLKITRFVMLLLLATAAAAQTPTTIAPNLPVFGLNVLTGSVRQISAQIGNPTPTGPGFVITIALDSGGTGFTGACQGQQFTIDQAGSNSDATVTIQNVSGGAVTSILTIPSHSGTAHYSPASGVATAPAAGTNCPGTGLTVNITSVSICAATGGYTCEVNWSVLSTTGGATATFRNVSGSGLSTVTASIPTIEVDIAGSAGSCSFSPPYTSYEVPISPPFSISSTATVTIEAQSIDDPSSTAFFPINVCATQGATLANGTSSAVVWPAYQQMFKSQPVVQLYSNVIGSPNPAGTWSLVSGPSGGNGALSTTAACEATTTSCRDVVFTASVTGRYVVQFTSAATGGTAQGVVYVSPNALPAYSLSPDGTPPQECYPDPANTGTDYEVGPTGFPYATINAVTSSTIPAGSIIRVHNIDTTGSSPTSYNEYYQLITSGNPGTNPATGQYNTFCGVPDSQGNLPIMEMNGASAQAGFSPFASAGYGGLTTYPGPSFRAWINGTAGPSYWYIANLHIKDGNYSNPYNQPGGVSTTCSNTVQNGNTGGTGTTCYWNRFTSCINIRGGTYIHVAGIHEDNCALGTYSNDNATSLWGDISQQISFFGIHTDLAGTPAISTNHGAYLQGFNIWYQGNRLDNWVANMDGACIKWRAIGGATRNNYCAAGTTRVWDGVEVQGAAPYVSFEQFLFWDGIYSEGVENIPADVIAAYQEMKQNDYVQGNPMYTGANNTNQIHYFADVDNGMVGRNGTLWFNFNTLDQAAVVFFNGEGDPFNLYLPQSVVAQDNIIWSANGKVPNFTAIDAFDPLIFTGLTNLFYAPSISITTPITGGDWEAHSGQPGWQAGCYWTPCLWPISNPMQTHIYSLTSANYLTTTTQPYDPTTMAPVVGSASIAAGTALTGLAALIPPRWEYSTNTGTLIARTDTAASNPTIGAVQGTPPPTLSSIAITPTTATVGIGAVTSLSGTCFYSNGTSATCTSALTWSTTNSAVAVFNVQGQATGVAVGTVFVTAVEGGVTSNTATLSVTVQPSMVQKGVVEKGVYQIN